MNEKDYKTVEMMEWYGGSFVQALARLARKADYQNLAKIKETWSEYWRKYEKMGENRD